MKKGISLIVLVIIIIVMIILAAAVVISLNNSSVIDRADHAVQVTNAKQVEQLAALAWADAYASGEREVTKLQEAVDAAMTASKVDTNIFQVTASATGVVVVDKTAKAEITFTIAGTTYKAVEGSTWTEWANSTYNTAEATISSSKVYIGSKYVTTTSSGSTAVSSTATITSGTAYGTYGTSGSDEHAGTSN